MDPALRALCMEVIDGDVDSERFALLLIETGIRVESLEWEVAGRLLGQKEEANLLNKMFGNTIQ